MVTDPFFAELVGGKIAFRSDEPNLCARHEPAQRSQPPAYGTIAFLYAMQVSFDFKRYVAAVAAALVNHLASSSMLAENRVLLSPMQY
jgi:hypothetical protein